MIRTVIAREKGVYSAFPTFVCHRDELFLYYREGQVGAAGTHGKRGAVRLVRIPEEAFLANFEQKEGPPLAELGHRGVVFCEGNEMDAIVSDLGREGFALATRSYDKAGRMRTYISFADEPLFTHRREVRIPDLKWHAFYGKGLLHKGVPVFPAYGALASDGVCRPLLLTTRDRVNWELLATLPSGGKETGILNESSLVYWHGRYHLFTRRDTPPYGLWHSRSVDLCEWTPPTRLCDNAHAPMALRVGKRLHLVFRRIYGESSASTALWVPFEKGDPLDLEHYTGNIFDGGYADMGLVGGKLYVFYYQGNPEGEPYICCWRADDK